MSDPFVGPTSTATVAVPTQWQTDRQDVHSAIIDMVTAFVAAYPNYVRKVAHNRPLNPVTGESPLVYIGRIRERTEEDDRGTRQTVFEGELGYCDYLGEPEQTDERVNRFADFMRELFTYNARCLSQGVFYVDGFDDSPEVKQGTNVYATDVQLAWHFVVLRGAQIASP